MNPDETTDPKTNVYDEITLSNALIISVSLNYNYLTIETKTNLKKNKLCICTLFLHNLPVKHRRHPQHGI